ncbi:MAG: hypothetical protein NTX57_02265 [Armatimonadetes bacterium]|nr:hypothetical protein [Armatimonadota bacterium]
MTIRDARPDEAARVYAITRSAFLEYAADVPPPSALFETEAEVVKELSAGNHHAGWRKRHERTRSRASGATCGQKSAVMSRSTRVSATP